MDKVQELQEWKNRLKQIVPNIKEQLEWMQNGNVKAEVNPSCPEKLLGVAQRLVELQNSVGEYQRSQISKEDIERIKYFSKTEHLSFDHVIKSAVSDSRYLSKTAIEARGVAGFILEIQSVYKKYYEKNGALPINAMNAEVKRACRNFKTDVSIKDKVEAIIDVFLPELQGIKIVDKDPGVEPVKKTELSSQDIITLIEYFNSLAEKGKIDKCFDAENHKEFLKHCKVLSKANISLDEFLNEYTGLTYSRCYEIQVIPAIEHMIKSHKARKGTTRNITQTDPYLRHKIEVAEKLTGKYSMVDLVEELNIIGDNTGNGRAQLTNKEIGERRNLLLEKLKRLYPTGQIDKDFIKQHPDVYEELKLVSNRFGYSSMDAFLTVEGFHRESFHTRTMDSVFYLSEGDLNFYHFGLVNPQQLREWGLKELEPAEFIGVYNKLIALGNDHMQCRNENPEFMEK